MTAVTRVNRPAHGPAVAAAAGLVVLVIVPPLLLATLVGDPLPHTAPTGHSVTRMLRAPLSDSTVVRLVALVAWMAWGHLVACVVAEVVGQLRGRRLAVPFGGVNQRLAHQLVALTLVALPSTGAAGVLTHALPAAYPTATAASLPAGAPLMTPVALSRPEPPRPVTPFNAAPGAAQPGQVQASAPIYKEYVVAPPHGRRHDNLWDIADRHLGDPLRWREIYALNEGRLMPDGQRLTHANLICPGWVLRMPADATGVHVVSGPAEPHAPAPPASRSPRSTSPTSPVDAHATGAEGDAPDVPVQRPAAAQAPASADSPAAHRHAEPAGQSSPQLPAVPIGAGLAVGALGVLAALERRRRVAARRRVPGTRPLPTPTDLVEVERKLRRDARAAAPVVSPVRASLRLAAARRPQVAVRGVLHHPDGGVELLHDDRADEPPAPFTATRHGWLLALADQGFLLAVDDDVDPAPLLVPVGTVDAASCYLNLEVHRQVCVSGEPEQIQEFVAGIVQALAGAPWSNLTQVVVPARLADVATGLERIDVLGGDGELLEHLTVYGERVIAMLSGYADLAAARRDGSHDDVGVVLMAGLAAAEIPDRLRQLMTDPRCPVRAIMAGSSVDDIADVQWRLDGEHLSVPGLGVDVTVRLVPRATVTATSRLLTEALDPTPPEPGEAIADTTPECPANAAERSVAVNVLGPVEILGVGTAKRAGVRDLALYLALHRRAVPADVLATTVWPDREFNPDLMRTRMSETRRLLDNGVVHEGRTWRMLETVGCDWQRFQALAAGDEDDRRAALALVRGRPFEGYDAEWVRTEGLDRIVEAAIVDLALDVGQRALDRGDPQTAGSAANVGITACPYDERLYRLGMRAAAARGASGEARNLLNALRTVLDEQVEPDDQIEPETLEEYRRATKERQRAAG